MIYGIGTDICDIRRLTNTLQKHGESFARRILGQCELTAYLNFSKQNPKRALRYLATRFSTKEAFGKAIRLGIRAPMRWQDCETLNAASGQPEIILHGDLQIWCQKQSLKFHVSLSDEHNYAISFVTAQTIPETSV